MMVMTAKVDLKKIAIIAAAVIALFAALLLFLPDGKNDAETSAPGMASNDARVKFLKDFGWDVTNSPAESSQVRIPETDSDVFSRYNALQKSQGYDLSSYAGKTVMRYVYKINNYPGAEQPVYATLLVYKNQVIGGDVTDSSPRGKIRGFKMPSESTAPTTYTTQPSAESAEPSE